MYKELTAKDFEVQVWLTQIIEEEYEVIPKPDTLSQLVKEFAGYLGIEYGTPSIDEIQEGVPDHIFYDIIESAL